MNFDNGRIRRQDRLLAQGRAMELLRNGEYGVLSLCGESAGYGIPLNYADDGDKIYFHCAPEGEKLQYIARNPQASFCVVGRTEVQPDKFSTGYESVIARGAVEVVDDDVEKMEALKLILKKYSPEFYETGLKYSRASFDRVTVLRMNIETISGKTKNIW